MRLDKLNAWAVPACMEAISAHTERFARRPWRLEIDLATYIRVRDEMIGLAGRMPRLDEEIRIFGVPLAVVGI